MYNLNTLDVALTSVVKCHLLQISTLYINACCGHVIPKACEWATNNDNVCQGYVRVVEEDASISLEDYHVDKEVW